MTTRQIYLAHVVRLELVDGKSKGISYYEYTPRPHIETTVIHGMMVYNWTRPDNVGLKISPVKVGEKIIYTQLGKGNQNEVATLGETYTLIILLTPELARNLRWDFEVIEKAVPDEWKPILGAAIPEKISTALNVVPTKFKISMNPMANCAVLNRFSVGPNKMVEANGDLSLNDMFQILLASAYNISDNWYVTLRKSMLASDKFELVDETCDYCSQPSLRSEDIAALSFFIVMFCVKPLSDGVDTVVTNRAKALGASFPTTIRSIGSRFKSGIGALHEVMSINPSLRRLIICSIESLSESQYYPQFKMVTSYAGTKGLQAIDTAISMEGGIAYIAQFSSQVDKFVAFLDELKSKDKTLESGKYCGDLVSNFSLAQVQGLYEFSVFVLNKHGLYKNMSTKSQMSKDTMEEIYKRMPKISSTKALSDHVAKKYGLKPEFKAADPNETKNQLLMELVKQLSL